MALKNYFYPDKKWLIDYSINSSSNWHFWASVNEFQNSSWSFFSCNSNRFLWSLFFYSSIYCWIFSAISKSSFSTASSTFYSNSLIFLKISTVYVKISKMLVLFSTVIDCSSHWFYFIYSSSLFHFFAFSKFSLSCSIYFETRLTSWDSTFYS